MDFIFSEDFAKEAKIYNLKYKCIDCTHYQEKESICSLEYPITGHNHFYILDYGENHIPRFTFCKYFEINS